MSRLVEQLVPAIVIGAIVVFANYKVTEAQVGDLRGEVSQAQTETIKQQGQIQSQAEKLAGITAQISAFLGQQVQMNSAMDARVTYIERERLAHTTVIR